MTLLASSKQFREISEQQARLRLRRTIDFARGEEAERDERLARIDLRLVNRELVAFGYAIEAFSYARNRYVASRGPDALAGASSLEWCARLILRELGLPVRKHRRAFFETDFAKVRREYRRRMDAEGLLGEIL